MSTITTAAGLGSSSLSDLLSPVEQYVHGIVVQAECICSIYVAVKIARGSMLGEATNCIEHSKGKRRYCKRYNKTGRKTRLAKRKERASQFARGKKIAQCS